MGSSFLFSILLLYTFQMPPSTEGPEEELLKDKECGTSLVVQWLRPHFSMQGVWVWSLGGELSSHMPHGQKIKTQNLEG